MSPVRHSPVHTAENTVEFDMLSYHQVIDEQTPCIATREFTKLEGRRRSLRRQWLQGANLGLLEPEPGVKLVLI